MKNINVAILGLGTVGGGTYKILNENADIITERTNRIIKVTKIFDRNFKRKISTYSLDPSMEAKSPDEIFDDESIDIVIEAIGGVEVATDLIIKAMKSGKSVVTPNKATVAANLDLFKKTADENHVALMYEASVAGGIPILTTIKNALAGNEFIEIMGIVNGTTNYILTKMHEEGLPYGEVLKDAQEKGFAEADPTADVEGIDAANKLTILMYLAFGKYIKPDKIPTVGISKITMSEINEAKSEGSKIKLIAHAKIENGELTYGVSPVKIANSHPLAGVSNEFNAVYITGNAVDELMFYGKGAGALPTGSAIVGDVISIARHL